MRLWFVDLWWWCGGGGFQIPTPTHSNIPLKSKLKLYKGWPCFTVRKPSEQSPLFFFFLFLIYLLLFYTIIISIFFSFLKHPHLFHHSGQSQICPLSEDSESWFISSHFNHSNGKQVSKALYWNSSNHRHSLQCIAEKTITRITALVCSFKIVEIF